MKDVKRILKKKMFLEDKLCFGDRILFEVNVFPHILLKYSFKNTTSNFISTTSRRNIMSY